jgi:D-xylose 1-dehydrogenase (NADP+, D-xylono-1,5-lactone-forming)
MTDKVHWGVMGCAGIAINHVIPAMLQAQDAMLWGVASRTLAKAQQTASRFGAQRAYGSYQELLDDPDIEAVYIPLPNHLHMRWSIAAVRAGKHVLCEKPIALNGAEARAMQVAAQETGRFLIEAFAYRFGPVVQKAIEIVRAGTLGDLYTLDSSLIFPLADNPADVRLQADIGGGALYDVGCYAINMQRMLAGREPHMAWAKFNMSSKYHVDMSVAGMLDFDDGLLGTFSAGFVAPGGSFARVVGSKGYLEIPNGWAPREGEVAIVVNLSNSVQTIMATPANAYMLEVQDLSEAIRGQHAPFFAWEPLDATVRVLDACFSAARFGQAVEV